MGREVILLRTSERTQYKRCRWAWWQSYVECLKPKTEAPALRFGTLIHAAMELRYPPGVKRGPHPAETFERLYEEELKSSYAMGFSDADGKWNEAGELGIAMMNAFVDEFGDDDRYEVISSEQTFQVPFHRTPKYDFQYVGTFDGVWKDRHTGNLLFTDWKTCKAISTSHLTLDEQAGSYWAYGPEWLRRQGLLKKNEQIKGILYTFLRKAKPDPRPRDENGHCLNKDGSVSKQQPLPLFHREFVHRGEPSAAHLRQRVKREASEMMHVRNGKLAALKNPGAMTCGMCGFRDLCELHESGADWESYKSMEFRTWDPYEAHKGNENDNGQNSKDRIEGQSHQSSDLRGSRSRKDDVRRKRRRTHADRKTTA